MTDETPKPTPTGEHPATNTDVNKAMRWASLNSGLAFFIAFSAAVGAVFGGWQALAAEARDAGSTAAQTLAVRVQRTEVDAEAAKLALVKVQQEQEYLRADVHEMQQDLRALSRQMASGIVPERLTKPPPDVRDGGQ